LTFYDPELWENKAQPHTELVLATLPLVTNSPDTTFDADALRVHPSFAKK